MSERSLQGLVDISKIKDGKELLKFISKKLLNKITETFNTLYGRMMKGQKVASRGQYTSSQLKVQKKLQQIIMSSFQIMEALTKDQQFSQQNKQQENEGILSCSN